MTYGSAARNEVLITPGCSALGEIDGWKVCWLVAWDRDRLIYRGHGVEVRQRSPRSARSHSNSVRVALPKSRSISNTKIMDKPSHAVGSPYRALTVIKGERRANRAAQSSLFLELHLLQDVTKFDSAQGPRAWATTWSMTAPRWSRRGALSLLHRESYASPERLVPFCGSAMIGRAWSNQRRNARC